MHRPDPMHARSPHVTARLPASAHLARRTRLTSTLPHKLCVISRGGDRDDSRRRPMRMTSFRSRCPPCGVPMAAPAASRRPPRADALAPRPLSRAAPSRARQSNSRIVSARGMDGMSFTAAARAQCCCRGWRTVASSRCRIRRVVAAARPLAARTGGDIGMWGREMSAGASRMETARGCISQGRECEATRAVTKTPRQR